MSEKFKESSDEIEDDFVDNDYIFKKVAKLKSEEKYDEIYLQFGSKIYNRNVPKKYRKQDLKKLTEEGRYLDIFHKYGEDEYNKILIKSMYNEIKANKGIIRAIIWRAKQHIFNGLQILGISTALLLPIGTTGIAIEASEQIDNNSTEYKQQISEYNKRIDDYANEIQSMKLEDLEIFMKVMDDMWGSIKGYGEPEKDIMGFFELDLATEDGVGVCRNMASDIAKKLNAIDPKYNARIMNVYLGEDGDYQIADIKRNIIESNDTVVGEESEIADDMLDNIVKVVGNHMVTLVDIPEEKLTLVLDPTNPGIGVYQNGKIIMLNSDSENGKNYSAKEFANVVFINGIDSGTTVAEGYISSFQRPNLTMEEIKEKYGVDAQNKALEEVRNENEFEKRVKEGITPEIIKTIESGELAHKENSSNLEKDDEERI